MTIKKEGIEMKMENKGIEMGIRKEIIKKYFNAWVQNDVSELEDIFDVNVVYTECYGPEYHGIKQILQWFSDWQRKGKVIEWNIRHFICEDDKVVVEWYFQCNYENNIDGFDGVSIITFNKENKIITLKEFQSKATHVYPYE
jgi:SnoaL-like polyketide cyclase.